MNIAPKKKGFLELFPTPEFLLLSSAALAMTNGHTKIVQLKRELFGSGLKLAVAEKMKNPPGAVEAGVILKPEELAAALRKVAERRGLRYVRATLPEEKAYLFVTSVERVTPENLRDAVGFIIEENAPVKLSESVFNFEVIKDDRAAGKIKVAVTVVPLAVTKSFEALLESAGLTPLSFEVESQAIARAVVKEGDRRPYLILNLGSRRTGCYVVADEVVQFSITVAIGIGSVNSETNLADLKVEIRKVLSFWSGAGRASGQDGSEIENAIICGRGATKSDFVEELMKDIGLGYSLADVWQNFNLAEEPKSLNKTEALSYAAAVGLNLRNIRHV